MGVLIPANDNKIIPKLFIFGLCALPPLPSWDPSTTAKKTAKVLLESGFFVQKLGQGFMTVEVN